ncbi:ROK family glucokinase [Dermabacteraceae bacterium P13115]
MAGFFRPSTGTGVRPLRRLRGSVAPFSPRPQKVLSVGVDIGGTHVKAGVVAPDGTVLQRLSVPTPTRSPEATEEAIVEVVSRLRRDYRIRSIGIGAAGFVDRDRAKVVFSPHLAWRHEPLRDRVQSRLGLHVVVENDANAAAWAESRFGAAHGVSSVVMVTLGTGIGGAVVSEGRLQRGRYGMAGEFGHMMLVPKGQLCACGNRGCWEQYAGGSALIRSARELAESNSPVASSLLAAAGGEPSLITGQTVSECAAEGDSASIELLHEMGGWLGIGLANVAAALDPAVLVVGGGVSAAGEMLLSPAREAFHRQLTGRGFRPAPPLLLARLGNDAGFIGAADLARLDLSGGR